MCRTSNSENSYGGQIDDEGLVFRLPATAQLEVSKLV